MNGRVPSGRALTALLTLFALGLAPGASAGTTGSTPAGRPRSTPCGPAWREVPVTGIDWLNAVTVISSTDAWAVGASPATNTLSAAHWDGTAWTKVSIPALDDSTVFGVDATGPDDVW